MELRAYEQLLALAVLRSRFAERDRVWRSQEAPTSSTTRRYEGSQPKRRRGGSVLVPPRAGVQA